MEGMVARLARRLLVRCQELTTELGSTEAYIGDDAFTLVSGPCSPFGTLHLLVLQP
jgi:hypothetical protein